MKNIIYGLVDPNTNEIRYIGKSISGQSRPREHFTRKKCLEEKNHKANWIRKLKQSNQVPNITVLHITDNPEELFQLEIDYIKKYRDMGYNLTNLTNGGEGNLGWIMSDETKKKISDKAKNNPIHKQTLQAANEKKKIQHKFINNIENKHCSDCDTYKPISEFYSHKTTWDRLERLCKNCEIYRKRERDAKNRVVLTEEELKQSYIDRNEAMTNGVKAAYENDPTLKDRISKAKKKAIVATHIITGEVIEFASGLDAKAAGHQNTNIGQAIKFNKPYKGYIWKFKV